MPEAHPRSELEQPVGDRGVRRVGADPEERGRAPHQDGLAQRLGGGEQQQAPGVVREAVEPLPEAALDPRAERGRARPEAAGQFRRRQPARQLEEGQRVAARLRDDPVPHARVQDAGDRRGQQRARLGLGQALDHQLWQRGQLLRVAGARGEEQPDRLRHKPARDERQRLR